MAMKRNAPLSTLVLCLWFGSLWTICGIVVPGIFWLLGDTDKRLAGNVAAQFFYLEVWLGAVLGVMYWLLRRHVMSRSTHLWLWAAIIAPLVFFAVLRPIMNALRAAGDLARFGQMHGVASLLFLIACVGVAVVAWRHLMPVKAA